VCYEYREPPGETAGEPECPLRRIPFEDATVSKWPRHDGSNRAQSTTLLRWRGEQRTEILDTGAKDPTRSGVSS
jgi:hypothetical protein